MKLTLYVRCCRFVLFCSLFRSKTLLQFSTLFCAKLFIRNSTRDRCAIFYFFFFFCHSIAFCVVFSLFFFFNFIFNLTLINCCLKLNIFFFLVLQFDSDCVVEWERNFKLIIDDFLETLTIRHFQCLWNWRVELVRVSNCNLTRGSTVMLPTITDSKQQQQQQQYI